MRCMQKKAGTQPILFFPETKQGKKDLHLFLRSHKYIRIVDGYREMLEDICAIRNPGLRRDPVQLKKTQKKFVKEHANGSVLEDLGTWVYYPWMRTIVHVLEEELHEELRTARNRNLITADEQTKYRDCVIAVAGLSVGSHAAVSVMLQGGGHTMRLADADTISGTNLNRIRTGFQTIGIKKTQNVAQEIYEMNPYAKLTLYPHGLTDKNIHAFLSKPKKIDVLIEEMDSLLLKVLIRQEAKKLKIPVIMAADNGDGIILDVERYDIEEDVPILGGRIGDITPERVEKATPAEMAQLITNMIDPKAVSPRMRGSVEEVGKSLYSWPQLGGAAQMSGVALAYAARMIATGGPLKSGRTIISLELLLSFNKLV